MPNKKRLCTNCKKRKDADKGIPCPIGFFCDEKCRREYGIKRTQALQKKTKERVKKDYNRETVRRKKELRDNDKRLRTKEAQKAFNAYIRARDNHDSCISCERINAEVESTDGWKVGGAWDCGHYLTVGAHPELRFEELNAHKQCKPDRDCL